VFFKGKEIESFILFLVSIFLIKPTSIAADDTSYIDQLIEIHKKPEFKLEDQLWNLIKKSRDKQDMILYLKLFPLGKYSIPAGKRFINIIGSEIKGLPNSGRIVERWDFYIQLGVHGSQTAAQNDYIKFEAKAPYLLSKFKPIIKQRGSLNRIPLFSLRIGPFDKKKDAQALKQRLLKYEIDVLVIPKAIYED
jgi:hypothetical protein